MTLLFAAAGFFQAAYNSHLLSVRLQKALFAGRI